MMGRSAVPAGTVTFLFTDIEDSTAVAQKHPKALSELLARHHAILREAIEKNGGYIFQIVGDSFCAAFNLAPQAVNAAVHAQRMLHEERWEPAEIRVRMGITTGSAQPGTIDDLSTGYTGYATLARAQRVMSAAHGGQILLSQSAVELVRAELPDGVTLREMGTHRFKGFPNPETVWQAVASNLPHDFPPLKSLAAIRNNLPVQVTSFIGREDEIQELKRLLRNSRILTLTGAGGTGKTRLSLELAGELLDSFKDGVWFVDLAPLVDPALMTNVIASTLGVQEEQGTRVFETILRFLEARVLVLILDNCEHMLDACRRFADVVVHSCRELRLLCTSREALGIAGEQVWHVASLPTADPHADLPLAEMEGIPAIHLFVERSRSVSPAFRLTAGNVHAVAFICHRLDGIPLALELAAARVRQLGVEQIAARLGESFRLLTTGNLASASRQQTLRALIDWSYALLTDPERMMLRRLAVFAGGWTIDAAESVCAGELLPKEHVLELMLRLADKSLLLIDERDNVFRYRMLETIRQYAVERLAESRDHADVDSDSGEEGLVRIRHRDWCLRFAEEAGMGIGGAEDVLWLKRVEAEHDNLRSVLKQSLELRDIDSGLRLAGKLWQFWLLRGHFTEGIQWMQRLLSEGSGNPALRAEALLAAASLSFRIGEVKAARIFGLESLSLFASQKNNSGAGRAAYVLGVVSWFSGDEPSRPNEFLSQSFGFAKESGLPLTIAAALNSMAFLACFEGDYPRAQDLLEDALSELRNGREDPSARASFVNLAWATPICDERGDWRMVVEETLAPFRAVGTQLAIGYTLANLGGLARSGGDLSRAEGDFVRQPC